MKINSINQTYFKGSIIDSHMHYGRWGEKGIFLGTEALDKFIKSPLNVNINGQQSTDTIDKILVSSLDCIDEYGRLDEAKGLGEALEFAQKNDKISILAVCQPNLTQGDTSAIRGALEKSSDKVVGFKFHPRDLSRATNGDEISASHKWYRNYMELAQEKKLPCLFHCDSDISGADEIYKLVKGEFKDVPVILGHTGAGSDANFEEALNVLKTSIKNNDAKMYCDISWLDWKDGLPDGVHTKVKTLITELKEKGALDRILFGTDAPLGCFGENLAGDLSEKEVYEKTVSGLKTMIKQELKDDADDIMDKIFYKNAQELFFEKKWIEGLSNIAASPETSQAAKKLSKTQIGLICTGAVVAVCAIGALLYNKFKKPDSKIPSTITSQNISVAAQNTIASQPMAIVQQLPPVENSMQNFLNNTNRT